MKYTDLDKHTKMRINGIVSSFSDLFIRNNQVWCHEQMLEYFINKIHEDKNDINKQENLDVFEWFECYEGKNYLIDKFENILNTKKTLCRKEPIVETNIIFGTYKRDDFSIGYTETGINPDPGMRLTLSEIDKQDYIPYSINHLSKAMINKYKIEYSDAFEILCKSEIEKRFYKTWQYYFYQNKNYPALIPEIRGGKSIFCCFKNNNGLYFSSNNYNINPNPQIVNLRFDFGVINNKKNKKILIELDGHDYHKTKKQRNNDAVKRNKVLTLGWEVIVFTGDQIYRNIDDCFRSILNHLII